MDHLSSYSWLIWECGGICGPTAGLTVAGERLGCGIEGRQPPPPRPGLSADWGGGWGRLRLIIIGAALLAELHWAEPVQRTLTALHRPAVKGGVPRERDENG